MFGQMMHQPLLISSLIEHAADYHGDTQIVSIETDGTLTRHNWRQIETRARQLGSALLKMGLQPSARCATIAWNNHRHLEIYFGVSGSNLVCHTINPRLFAEQLVYVMNHAQDEVLFVDETFLPLVAQLRDDLKTLKAIVLMGPPNAEAEAMIPGILFYDAFIAQGATDYQWPQFDEMSASSICYTSGTTGNPKGVLYSHRSTVLHSLAVCLPDSMGISARDTVLPVVPMFHVNAWGVPYAAALCGARMALPGPGLDGDSLVDLIDTQKVTIALGVPTIWQGLLTSAKTRGSKLSSLKNTIVGGSACPPSMITAFRDDFGVETIHAWGMTELSPIGSANRLLAKHRDLPQAAQAELRNNQGRPPWGIKLRTVGDDGVTLARDGKTQGDLMVRGHWVVDSYFKEEAGSALTNGWFNTGDVATLDGNGYMTIRDRSKDIIKSGGEWISSVELEGIAMGHAEVADAAVIGAKHTKWDERPILIVVKAPGSDPQPRDLLAFFEGKIARWQIPDAVVFVDTLPRNATGKILKRALRDTYGDILLQQDN